MATPILLVLADIADVGYDAAAAVPVVIDDVVDPGVGVIPK